MCLQHANHLFMSVSYERGKLDESDSGDHRNKSNAFAPGVPGNFSPKNYALFKEINGQKDLYPRTGDLFF